jgi:hypothetical protein
MELPLSYWDKTMRIEILKQGGWSFLLIVLLASIGCSQQKPQPPAGVARFESSRFCGEFKCVLDSVEPLAYQGKIEEYFYDYRASFADGTPHSARFGLRLAPDGRPGSPYLIVRWFPVKKLTDRDFAGINALSAEITGAAGFDASAFVLDFAKGLNLKAEGPETQSSPPAVAGKFRLTCSFTRGKDSMRYPQLTLLFDEPKL